MRDLEITDEHKYDKPELLKPIYLGVVGLVASAIAWLLLRTNDDRPPIRVRGGSVRFENDWGWKDAGGEWTTRQQGARKVKYFTVLVDGKPCGLQKAVQLNIIYERANGSQATFKVIHRNGEPWIIPGGSLDQDPFNFDSIVHDPDGNGRLVEVGGPPNPHNTCALPKFAVLIIDYEYK
jgi:hypothetical protein